MDVGWIRFWIIKTNENYRKTIDKLLEKNSESDENSDRR